MVTEIAARTMNWMLKVVDDLEKQGLNAEAIQHYFATCHNPRQLDLKLVRSLLRQVRKGR